MVPEEETDRPNAAMALAGSSSSPCLSGCGKETFEVPQLDSEGSPDVERMPRDLLEPLKAFPCDHVASCLSGELQNCMPP